MIGIFVVVQKKADDDDDDDDIIYRITVATHKTLPFPIFERLNRILKSGAFKRISFFPRLID